MNDDQSRDVLSSLVLITALPTQIAAMVTQEGRGILDWVVLGALLFWGWAHVDAGRERMKQDHDNRS